MRACWENYSCWCTEATNLHLWLQTLRAPKHTHRQTLAEGRHTLNAYCDCAFLSRQWSPQTQGDTDYQQYGYHLPMYDGDARVKQASPTCSCADNDHQIFGCSIKMALDCVKKQTHRDNKDQFDSHYIKSVLKGSQYWQLRCWETFMALVRTFQWLYLPPLLLRLLAALWPTGEVLNWFHIILEFLKCNHISTARTSNLIIHMFIG